MESLYWHRTNWLDICGATPQGFLCRLRGLFQRILSCLSCDLADSADMNPINLAFCLPGFVGQIHRDSHVSGMHAEVEYTRTAD